METYSVEAILSATDKGFTSAMKKADDSLGGLDDKSKKASVSIADIAKGVGVFKLVDSAVNMVTSSLGGAIGRFDTLNKYPVVMEALGYSTQEVDKSMNKLTQGIDGLPTKLDDIVANTQQLAISTGSLDKGTDTAIALNNAFLASGASSADAARGMEQYRQMLGRGEVDMQSFKSVQETMPIAMDKVAKSFKDRGVTSVNELYDALKGGEITFTEFNDRLIELNDGVGGFADLAQKNSKGIQTSFENIKSAVIKGVEKTVRALDEGLQGAGLGSIADNLDKVKNVVNQTFGVINAVIPPAIQMFVDFLGVIKPHIPLITALVGWWVLYSATMGTVSKVTKIATGVQKVFNAVMNANKYVVIISALIVFVTTLIYVWNTNEDFRNAVIKIWNSIKEAFSETLEAIQGAWENTKEFFKNSWSSVSGWFNNLWDGMKQAPEKAAKAVENAWKSTKEWFGSLWDGVKESASNSWNSVIETVKPYATFIMNIFKPLTNFFTTLWDSIKVIAAASWELIKSVIAAPLLLIIDLITGDFTQMAADMQMIWDTMVESVSFIWQAIKDIIVSYITAILGTATNIWNELYYRIKNIGTDIMLFLDKLWLDIKYSAIQKWIDFKFGVIQIWIDTKYKAIEIWTNLKNWFFDTVDAIVDGTIQGWTNLKNWTVETFMNMVDGAKNAWNELVNSVKNTVKSVTDTFNKIKDINLYEAGKAIMNSFFDGLQQTWKTVQKFVGGIGDWIRKHKGPIQYDRKLLIPAGNAIMDGLNAGLNTGFGKVQDNIGDMTKYFANTAFSQDFEIGANFSDLDKKINSMNDMNLSSNNELTLKNSARPAEIKLSMGGRVFSAFVEDIGAVMQAETDLNLQT